MHYGGPEIFLMICGGIGIVTLLFNLFSFIGDHPPTWKATALPSVDSDEFLRAVSYMTNSPVQEGAELTILNNGKEFFPALYQEIQNARASINFAVYIWEPGKISDRIFELFIQKAREGVQVRVLLDGFGGLKAPNEWIEKLRDAGGTVARFRPARLGKLTRFNRRNHRRAIIIDGKVGFTGGMAVGDKWDGNAEKKEEWRDMMFRLTDGMALSLQGAFAELWMGTTGEVLAGELFYPTFPVAHAVYPYISVASSPSDDTQPLLGLFWFSIQAARKKLYITSPYVTPAKQICDAIVERARAGVDVRLLMPNHLTDAKAVRIASQSYYGMFLKAGVRVYEYQPCRIHTKSFLADTSWSIIGSANMDVRSQERNEENVFGISDRTLAQQMERLFLEDLSKAKEFHLQEWEGRSVFAKFFERVFLLFKKQY